MLEQIQCAIISQSSGHLLYSSAHLPWKWQQISLAKVRKRLPGNTCKNIARFFLRGKILSFHLRASRSASGLKFDEGPGMLHDGSFLVQIHINSFTQIFIEHFHVTETALDVWDASFKKRVQNSCHHVAYVLK